MLSTPGGYDTYLGKGNINNRSEQVLRESPRRPDRNLFKSDKVRDNINLYTKLDSIENYVSDEEILDKVRAKKRNKASRVPSSLQRFIEDRSLVRDYQGSI